MNKISGILPSNARVTTVDLKNSGTARPGMPGFGRTMGISSVQEREIERSTAARANDERKGQADLRNPELDPKASIVQRLADDFFVNKAKLNDQEFSIAHDEASDMVVDLPADNDGAEEMKASPKKAISFSDLVKSNGELAEADDDSPVVGKYIDVQA